MAARTERERLEQVLLGQSALVFEVHGWLAEEQKRDDVIRAVVRSSRKRSPVRIAHPDPARIFHASAIRDLCIRYRLRFLESAYFKGEIPGPAIRAIRDLEASVHAPITSYMIMAPSERFKLCDSEVDPLLFVPIGNDRYYMVCKWGGDFARWRQLAYWPVRGPIQLIATVLLVAALITSLVPTGLLGSDGAFMNGQRVLLFVYASMILCGFTAFGWFAFFGQFSAQAWNSRFFNS